MLHDLFLYDWRIRQPDRKGLHAFTHGKLACENASKLFDLTQKEKDMILTHMWPVTMKFPTSIEGLILTFVDKYCATSETFEVLKSRMFMKKAFRYAYVFLMNSSGSLSMEDGRVWFNYGVRPVINLRADISLIGSGTTSDPFKVGS